MNTALRSKWFDDLDTFFTARRLKKNPAGEWAEDSYDYGVWWRDDHAGVYRLTWIGEVHREPRDGGELYLVRLSGPAITRLPEGWLVSAGDDRGAVEFLGVIPAACEDTLESTLDRYPGSGNDPARNVEEILDGWADVCGNEGSVQWVRDKVAAAVADGRALPAYLT